MNILPRYVIGWERRANWSSWPPVGRDCCEPRVAAPIPGAEPAWGFCLCLFEESGRSAGWDAAVNGKGGVLSSWFLVLGSWFLVLGSWFALEWWSGINDE